MKFALFVFCEDNSCAVGESSWISGQDESCFNSKDWKTEKEIFVRWPKAPKDYSKWSNRIGKYPIDAECETITYVAKVLRFGDKYDSIRTVMTTFMETGSTATPSRGRGMRTSKKNEHFDSENEEPAIAQPCKKIKTKTPSNSSVSKTYIQQLKDKISKQKLSFPETYSSGSSDEESEDEESDKMKKMRRQLLKKDHEIEELKKEVKKLRDVQNLQEIVVDLKDSVRHLKKLAHGDCVVTLESTPKTKSFEAIKRSRERTPLSPIENVSMVKADPSSASNSNSVSDPEKLTLCPGVLISKSQKKMLNEKHTAKLMPMLWSREVLCTHSVTGRQSNAHKDRDAKPQLDVVKIESICSYGSQKFDCTEKAIRQHMSTKMSNVIKCCKHQKL